jgi:hypothetical protein
LVLHTAVQWMSKLGYLRKAKLNRNTLFMSVLGGGALGSFMFAVTTGKNQVHNLHSIFQVGANPTGDLDYYQRTLQKARERGEDIRALEHSRLTDHPPTTDASVTNNTNPNEKTVDLEKLEQIRIIRRKTVNDSFRTGHGLSDSHGGHWVPDDGKIITDTAVPAAGINTSGQGQVDVQTLKQMQVLRRKSVNDSLRSGHGLSDSHGGRWFAGQPKQP